jgi:hypothetical protein
MTIQLSLQEEVSLKYLYNPATDEFESLAPTLRERFSLGSKDPTPETNTDGEVAGALMDAFPNSSFLKYQNAVEEGFQGTFEEFLRDTSDKSELDMKAIEGQTAGSLPKMLLEGAEYLTKPKSKKVRDPSPSNIMSTSKTAKEFKKLDEREQEYADLLLQNFKKITKNPQTKDIVPEKYKNIKDIRELVSDKKAYSKFITDLRDIQYKKITDEKGIDLYSKLPKTQQNNVKSLLLARNKSASLPKTNFINIAGDDFNIPNNIGVLPSQIKNLEKAYPLLKKLDKNPTVDNFYKNVTGQSKGGNVFINDIQAYLSGVDTRTRPVFDKPIEMQLLKSLDLENKLKPETIKILTEQKGQAASNRYKLSGMSEKAKKINLDNPERAASVKRIDEIYKEDPNISSDELVNEYYGNSFAKASIKEQKKMLGELRNDVVTYYKIINQARVPVKGVRLPSANKRAEILDSIEFQKGKGGFNIYGGYIRDIQNKIAESVTGYNSGSRIVTLSKKYSKQGNVDHSVGLGAVHEVAPGYAEAIQIIKPSINKQKGRVLERPLTSILNDFFSNTKNKARKIGDETYSNFDDKVAAYNNLSKEFANQNGVDTAIIKFSKPGTGPSPKETVTHFTEFSKGAQKNMMEVWNNHGLVIYTKSKPMRSESFAKTYKTNKNMGGIIEPMDRTMMAMGGRVGFQDGTPDPRFGQILSAFENPDLIDMLEKENEPSLKEEVYGDDGERNLIQTFNTMFADPKAYPYYAQEIASGASNIPELAFRFPMAALGLTRDVITGEEGKLKRAIETLDPKLTKSIKEKIGFTEMLEKSRAERTGPQTRTGGLLEIGAEVPGPATPYFLIKAFPKIAKQIKNLVGTGTAADKVNKEIENKIATQGVDQGRRDLLLATGAGGAVALLKYLGLDNLIKTTKVVKAAPEIVTKGGTPKYFFDFVSLIKSKGDDITEKASTLERQKVYDYKGYTMYEDMSSGEIRINKQSEGMGSGYDEAGELQTYDTITGQEEIMYKPGETIMGKDGKSVRTLDEYEEATAKPVNPDGDMEGEVGLDSIDEILELLSKDGKTYSKTELSDMGIDLDALGNYPTGAGSVRLEDLVKPKKAEGGIISGVKSGPPPKSGKTPHGLPYVAKNVRPIKERN